VDANALTPRALFDSAVCYEIPPFQRPYVWTEEDQWEPLWKDIVRVTDYLLEFGSSDPVSVSSHFLGAVVLKGHEPVAGQVARHTVIDGQQRLTTLQLLLDAAQLVIEGHGAEEDAESVQELVLNGAKRFRAQPSRFKLWPSRVDRDAFRLVMDNSLEVTAEASKSRIAEAHAFFLSEIREWAEVTGDPDKAKDRLSALAKVLQQHLQIVAIALDKNDDEQLIFEALNDRGTPLLAADLIKNFIFQRCEAIGADVDAWTEVYWKDFDEDWWRNQVAQGRLYRSRIDLFLQYWLTMRRRDEVPTDAVFSTFRSYAAPQLEETGSAEAFLKELRRDADTYRHLVTLNSGTAPAAFYARVVEALELGTFIPLLLWLISDNHAIAPDQVKIALDSVESWAMRRTLLRMTMKDINNLVVSMLRSLEDVSKEAAGHKVVELLAAQTADARLWPTDTQIRDALPSTRLYGNVKQPRLRVLLSAVELERRSALHEQLSLPEHLEIEHVMPRGWRTHWGADIVGDAERAAKRDVLVDTVGNLTLVTKKLNGTLSNRPWRDDEAAAVAPTGSEAGIGKRTLLNRFSLLVLNKEIVELHPDSWTETDIRKRAEQLTETVITIWPRPAPAARAGE
jgi:hypothetical protein